MQAITFLRRCLKKREETQDKLVAWHVAMKRGKQKAMAEDELKALYVKRERLKASIRAKVEHPFHVLKSLFHYQKVRSKACSRTPCNLHTVWPRQSRPRQTKDFGLQHPRGILKRAKGRETGRKQRKQDITRLGNISFGGRSSRRG